MWPVACGLWHHITRCCAVSGRRTTKSADVITTSPRSCRPNPPVAHKRTTVRHLLTSTPQAQCNGAVSLSQWLLMQMPKFRFLPVYFFS